MNKESFFSLFNLGILLSTLTSLYAIHTASFFPRYGIWFQSEIITLVSHSSTVLMAVGLAGVALIKNKEQTFVIPVLATIPFIIFLLGAVSFPFREFPLLHIWGLPEHGEGALSFLSLAIFIIGFSYANRIQWMRNILKFSILILLIELVVVTFLRGYKIPLTNLIIIPPYFFNDYLAFFSLFSIYLAFIEYTNNRSMTLTVIYSLLSVCLLILSDNLSAQIIIPVLTITFLLVNSRVNIITLGLAKKVIIILIIVLLPLAISYFIYGNVSAQSSLGSRVYLNQIWFQELLNKPQLLVTGAGWGIFEELLIRNSNLTGVSTFSSGGLPYWDTYRRIDFSSHNSILDNLGSGGIVCGVLFVMILVSTFFVKTLKPAHVFFAISILLLNSLWFLMPGIMATFVYCVTLFTDSEIKSISITGKRIAWLLIISSIVICGVIYYAVLPPISIRNYFSQNVLQSSDCVNAFGDELYGGYYTAKLLRKSFNLEGENPISDFDTASANAFICIFSSSENLLEKGSSLMLLTSNLAVRSDLYAHSQKYPDWLSLHLRLSKNWHARITQLIQKTPERFDLLIPYLTWEITEHNYQRAAQVVDNSLLASIDNPVGLWFKGIIELETGQDKTIALGHLKLAFQHGIERYMPVSKEIKNKIL